MIFDQPAEGGAVAGPRKCHEANDFRVGGVFLGGRHHQHRDAQFGQGHVDKTGSRGHRLGSFIG